MTPTTKDARFNIMIVGVGGQGILTAAKFLGDAASAAGLRVNVGQLHGMAQRGGSVECTVVFGPSRSSVVADGGADVVIGLEALEVLRALPKISRDTRIVLSTGKIVPFVLSMKGEDYPDRGGMLDEIKTVTPSLYELDAPAIAKGTGVPRTLNVAMLGAVAGLDILPFPSDLLWQAIEKRSPPRFIEANKIAFEAGKAVVQEQSS